MNETRSDTQAGHPTWTVWPCEHGGVQVEAGRVPPHHQCAVCGEKPIAVVPRHELVDAIGRLADESLKRRSVEAERTRLAKDVELAEIALSGIAHSLHHWQGDPADVCEECADAVAAICQQLREALSEPTNSSHDRGQVDPAKLPAGSSSSSHGSEDT